ncbi:anaerobic ribonucleoside-triphosphate reductase activating protein [Sporomusaceae bacterium BoRhaA]|uniref:anaerobic ribonucleoside-triphosphate reductase n=1 Tax=Pelorhabdus rhamnosifermentans TaxID=2772457 RepID=UPI001C05F38A|nr:anaerobic ribonucleoside-triphosphate reductase [Pelorhabdus rhamnosifermentans]MBU2700563.1 anaerobic ribonucleoside-triphosphate reductase activating protein [Pelorhabdus rhamnosifermentans]
MIIEGINVVAAPELSDQEVYKIVNDEIKIWISKNKTLAKIELLLDDENILVTAIEKSPIRRVRRITGYLSNMENFNDAKLSELNNRTKHVS